RAGRRAAWGPTRSLLRRISNRQFERSKVQMMIVMKEGASPDQVGAVVARVESVGAQAHVSQGELVTVIGAIGDREHVANLGLEGFPGVDHLTPITKPYKLSSLQFKKGERSVIEIGGRKIGGEHFATIA